MGVHIIKQWLQPTLRRLNIGIEKEVIVIVLPHPLERLIIALGKTIVLVESDNRNSLFYAAWFWLDDERKLFLWLDR